MSNLYEDSIYIYKLIAASWVICNKKLGEIIKNRIIKKVKPINIGFAQIPFFFLSYKYFLLKLIMNNLLYQKENKLFVLI